MSMKTLTSARTSVSSFPEVEVKERLQEKLQRLANESSILKPNRPEWEPLLDSKRVVGTVLVLEDLFPFKIPPDKVVRKGGYNDVDEAIDDMLRRLKKLWADHHKPKVRK